MQWECGQCDFIRQLYRAESRVGQRQRERQRDGERGKGNKNGREKRSKGNRKLCFS